ncbi:flavoprotein [Suillus discolor]|uniref:Flavoprotein n=1 Tax=Suillus discolor TaxID=1912936 RepID=A0A9P7F783_9AGAM|nr:flavoprotein [Suillus discolor]KAG2107932.1 flavoprotein [Suillus discolor]
MVARQFIAETERLPDHAHVLLITTGSVASIKAPLIVSALLQYQNVRVEVVATKESLAFYDPADVVNAGARVWTDEDEWSGSYKIGDPILHIELRRWADIVLTSLLRALAPTTPTYVFPAMNTLMYEHPLTAEHLHVVRDVVRYQVVGPIGKNLACGDVGLGAMTEWRDIVEIVVDQMKLVRKDNKS